VCVSEALVVAERKALGAFYTPRDAAHYMASWAIRCDDEVVLEPSIGDGVFVAAVQDAAATAGWSRPSFIASEINPEAAAEVIGRGLLTEGEVRLGDFLDAAVRPATVAIGNPPYVRLRALPAEQSAAALRAAVADIGGRMEPSGSVWMPFVSRAARYLRPGGRMALVLPWDFSYVRYARPLWRHLAETFGELRVVRVAERLFPDIGQDVLLLFADQKGRTTTTIAFETYSSVEALVAGRASTSSAVPIDRLVRGDRVFQEALLPSDVRAALDATRDLTVPTRERVTFNIGYVSGDKAFFHPGPDAGLPEASLRPALADARSLRRGGLRTSTLPASAVSRLWLPGEELTGQEREYVRRGERAGVHLRYKTRVRDPWYVVPYVKVPDLVLSVFTTRPLLMLNDAGRVATNSLLCGYLRAGTADTFAAGWYSSVTLLHAELEVHSLGGGVLVLVPKEAGSVRVLRPEAVNPAGLAEVDALLRSGEIERAYEVGDDVVSRRLGRETVQLIRSGVAILESWRVR
jgi:adenine-specific DNA-methyltransferase